MSQRADPETVAANWRSYLMSGEVPASGIMGRILTPKESRRLLQRLPADPRCRSCRSPFRGVGGRLMQVLGRRPSKLNPQLCDLCEQYVSNNLGGAEVELTILIADVRGSTTLAEHMNAAEYSRLINRFYRAATDVLVRADALIEKLKGDGIVAMFVPGFAGAAHASRAVEAGQAVLRVTGHGTAEGPWVPIGVGVHGGTAYVGAVGSQEGVSDIVALGDTVNTAARLSAVAGAGEILVSRDSMQAADLGDRVIEQRSLQLKGRDDVVEVGVVRP
jgi:adenylate cyclase